MEEKETFLVTVKEYGALLNVRGLKEKAHSLVMCAGRTQDGYFELHGSAEAFDELTSDLNEEIAYELSPKYQLKQLQKLYRRLAPDDGF